MESKECPYCKRVMENGIIHKDRYNLKWIPENKDKGAVLSPFIKGIKLTNNDKTYLEVYYCRYCGKMIFDM
ncbi:MAG TPA: PF20097 family protein [Lachnospiraceae bacterium]|nr:PF20097 family protein [Lachnospiraceae bacterium]